MSILKYFHPVKKSRRDQLPDPHGPLNIDGKVPSSAIASANIAEACMDSKSGVTFCVRSLRACIDNCIICYNAPIATELNGA